MNTPSVIGLNRYVGDKSYGMSPACPLEPHLASPNVLSVASPCGALSLLLQVHLPLRSEAIGCSCAHFPPPTWRVPSRVTSQTQLNKFGSATSSGRGPNTKCWGRSAVAADGFKAHRKIDLKESPEGARGIVLRTDPRRKIDFSKRIEAQGGSWGQAKGLVPDMSIQPRKNHSLIKFIWGRQAYRRRCAR